MSTSRSAPFPESMPGPETDEEIVEFLEAVLRGRRGAQDKPDTSPETLEGLRQALAQLREEHVFVPGQLVTWKPGLRNKRHPAAGGPVIVVEVLPEPVFDETEDSGSPFFREPLDLVAGWLDGDGDLQLYHFDSRRFQPYDG